MATLTAPKPVKKASREWWRIPATLTRIFVGWHLFYEGLVKLTDPAWSAADYLLNSKWIFSGFFQWLASDPVLLGITDWANIIVLTGTGLFLMLGIFTRTAAIAAAMLLLLYYLAYPPFIGFDYGNATEGNYLLVNKTLIESMLLIMLALMPSKKLYGIGNLLHLFEPKKIPAHKEWEALTANPEKGKVNRNKKQRRELAKNLASIPILGAFGLAYWQKKQWDSMEEKHLMNQAGMDGKSSATIKTFHFSNMDELKGQVPKGKIGNMEISRLFLGGNLIGGWAHARDLLYVSKLVKAYHHDEKVFETLQLAEKCGINTLLTNPILSRVINDYWKKTGGKIQFISDCPGLQWDDKGPHPIPFESYLKVIDDSVANGASACYIQGETADQFVRLGQYDLMAKALEHMKQYNIPVGIGAHRLETIQKSVELGFKPDFWMKTLHHHNYWSAGHKEQHDNMYCYKPEETIAFMEALEAPWIAFKVLAAGAIKPQDAFQYAFENGADFLCVGMYDFQVIEDVNITLDVLAQVNNRKRPWRG